MSDLLEKLKQKGYKFDASGNAYHPSRPLDSAEARKPEQRRDGEENRVVGEVQKGDAGRVGKKPAGGSRSCRSKTEVVVTVVALRKRLMDGHDNLRFACKPIVDSLTALLGFDDDSHPALIWQYGQIQTFGPEGLMVHIDVMELDIT